MSTQPSTDTLGALASSSSCFPRPLKRTFAKRTSPWSSHVVEQLDAEGRLLQRRDSFKAHGNVGPDGSSSRTIPARVDLAGKKKVDGGVHRNASLHHKSPRPTLLTTNLDPFQTSGKTAPTTISPSHISAFTTSNYPSLPQSDHLGRVQFDDNPSYQPCEPRVPSAAALAALATLSYSASKGRLPPRRESTEEEKLQAAAKEARQRKRRLATPRPDTGGDPCQVVKNFGLSRPGENFIQLEPEVEPLLPLSSSRAGSVKTWVGNNMSVDGKKGSRPCSQASLESAADAEMAIKGVGAGEGHGGKKAKKVKNAMESPRPDTVKDPCKVLEDLAWHEETQAKASGGVV